MLRSHRRHEGRAAAQGCHRRLEADHLGRGKPGARLLLALANESSARSLTGQSWLAEALRSGGVEVLVVDVEASLVEKILAAQELQKMVNPEENT